MMTRGKHLAFMALALAAAGQSSLAAQVVASAPPPPIPQPPEPRPASLTLPPTPAPSAWPAVLGWASGLTAPALPPGPNRRARRLAVRQAKRGRR